MCAADLWAKVTRALFYDLVELGEERDVGGEQMFGVASGGRVLRHGAGRQLEGIRLMEPGVPLDEVEGADARVLRARAKRGSISR